MHVIGKICRKHETNSSESTLYAARIFSHESDGLGGEESSVATTG